MPKRIVDKLVALLLLVALSPLLLIASIAALASGGRVLERVTRISRGRRFQLLKFASTKSSSSELTWAGTHLLRPWYLDELPQLLNILRGDMSLVGPRPWPPDMVDRQVLEGRDYRLRIMAGLTGPAQVTKGIVETNYEELDLAYVDTSRTLSSWRLVRYDFKIMRETLRVLARGEGLNF